MKIEKIKKVLIAVDFDPSAQKVAEKGFSLTKAIGAEVILLHVISDPLDYYLAEHITIMGFVGFSDPINLPLDNAGQPKKVSQDFLDKLKKHLGDANIKTVIKEGNFAESILMTAKDLNADFIVMGSHSRKWLENIVMGSVTEKVLFHSSIPLFIIPIKKQI
jgi:nucleotide-binding universal stress UspA family protein